MSDTDSLDYLQTDFDPTSLTVPRLRSILVNYDISYPSTAKKAQLLKIFVDEILPQRGRILKERERARRSSRGILNANSRQSIENDQEIISLSRSSRRNTRNSSSKLQVDEQGDDGATYKKKRTSSPVKKTPSASSKHARASDTETGLDPETRRKSLRTKKSETPSHFQSESVAADYDFPSERPKVKKEERRESAFTYDNPFQSGSSPLSGKSPESRRKSQGISKERRKISNTMRRRRTETPQINDDIFPPSSTIFEAPFSPSFSGVSTTFRNPHEIVIEPGEEFTPEEESELIREKATGRSKNMSISRKSRMSKNNPNFTGPIWVMILITLIGYSVWYRQEKIAVGYCDVGKEASPLISIPNGMPDWVRILLEPSCEPCPHHAYCLARMKVECEKDYILKHHPLSLAGIIPLAPTCEPDGVKVRKVKAVADRATEILREKRAKFECGTLDDDGAPISSPEVDANDLKKEVSKKRRKDMPEAEFEAIWSRTLEEMETRNEVQTNVNEIHYKLSSNSLASLPVTCVLRRSLCNTMGQYRFEIGGLVIFLLSLLKLRSIILTRRKVNAAIPSLVSTTLDRLSKQALMHQENKNIDRWISIGQLRDDVLRNEHSIDKRESMWRKVRIVIETNSNVRSSQKEGRNGEVSRVWEWIGALES